MWNIYLKRGAHPIYATDIGRVVGVCYFLAPYSDYTPIADCEISHSDMQLPISSNAHVDYIII